MAWLVPVRSPLLGEYHIDFLSSGYLDVSVPRVCSYKPMYSVYKYLVKNVISYRSSNNELSGGFPHSEIHGSKLILSSPWLIAEYHVFHRLLLPRHPPNALLALDLIQKETDTRSVSRERTKLACCSFLFLNQKSYIFPLFFLEPMLPMSVGPAWRKKNLAYPPKRICDIEFREEFNVG